MTQNQARQAWGVYPQMLVMLEHQGKLSPVAVGNRVYYRLDQLVELFGEPLRPEVLGLSTDFDRRCVHVA